jgi:hypothetical protein
MILFFWTGFLNAFLVLYRFYEVGFKVNQGQIRSLDFKLSSVEYREYAKFKFSKLKYVLLYRESSKFKYF